MKSQRWLALAPAPDVTGCSFRAWGWVGLTKRGDGETGGYARATGLSIGRTSCPLHASDVPCKKERPLSRPFFS